MSFSNLKTPWGQNVGDAPLQEYPRPQFVRKSYLNLNGWWNYAITKKNRKPAAFDGEILVPFSPECALSGVNRKLNPKEYLWYFHKFTLPTNFNKGVVYLHFGAVDSICDLYVNDKFVCKHVGGYNAFSADIAPYLCNGENRIMLCVQDFTDTKFYTNGKQSTHRKGMWYTPQSGIWQTVWLESVCKQHIENLKITPNFDAASVTVEVVCNFDEPVTVIVTDGETEVAKADGKNCLTLTFPDGKFKPWSPENPFLYGLKVISRRDMVESYFGMRKFSSKTIDGINRFMLNNKPYFQNGVLDQGYWPDGLYTAPSDDALIFDILTAKKLGFNMLRKHNKVESARWYYHCDRLGMLVWQDMPSGGAKQKKLYTLYLPHLIGKRNMKDDNYRRFSRDSQQSRDMYCSELREMIAQLYNCACIAVWVPFNEGWGQFDALKIAAKVKSLDSTRLVDHASGWHDRGGGDFRSMHIYFKPVRFRNDSRITALTEYGGYSYKDSEHSFNPNYTYAYKLFKTRDEFNVGVKQLLERDVLAQIPNGLSVAVFTQLSDVEDEVNGIVTYDRLVMKVDEEMLTEVNSKILAVNSDESDE